MVHRRIAILFFLFFSLTALPLWAREQVEIPTANSPSTGPEAAPVTIVEFIDFT